MYSLQIICTSIILFEICKKPSWFVTVLRGRTWNLRLLPSLSLSLGRNTPKFRVRVITEMLMGGDWAFRWLWNTEVSRISTAIIYWAFIMCYVLVYIKYFSILSFESILDFLSILINIVNLSEMPIFIFSFGNNGGGGGGAVGRQTWR